MGYRSSAVSPRFGSAAGTCAVLAAFLFAACENLLGKEDLSEGEKIVSECFGGDEPEIPTSAAKGRGFGKEETEMALFGPKLVRTCRPAGTPESLPVSGCLKPSGSELVKWAPGPALVCNLLLVPVAPPSEAVRSRRSKTA